MIEEERRIEQRVEERKMKERESCDDGNDGEDGGLYNTIPSKPRLAFKWVTPTTKF